MRLVVGHFKSSKDGVLSKANKIISKGKGIQLAVCLSVLTFGKLA